MLRINVGGRDNTAILPHHDRAASPGGHDPTIPLFPDPAPKRAAIHWPSRIDGTRMEQMLRVDIDLRVALAEVFPGHDGAARAIRDNPWIPLVVTRRAQSAPVGGPD